MTSRPAGFGAYVAVTAAYWAFMLTDGALRMLVLLHFHQLGFSPVQLAYLFLLYEFMGIVTNLSAGWLAARFGLTSTLFAGLILQILALIALAFLDPGWQIAVSVAFVMVVQGVSGIAKDLTKMSSKSAVKLLAPADQAGALFRWTATLTGSKNAVKGVGYFLGSALLAVFGFLHAVVAMAVALAVVLISVVLFMPAGLPGANKAAKFRDVWSKDKNINRLSTARVFLFGARDAWFVVGIPIYFVSAISDGSVAGNQTAFFTIGLFMAAWIMGYGLVQALAPRWLNADRKSLGEIVGLARFWGLILPFIPAILAVLALITSGPTQWLTATLITGLLIFGGVFAVNSSLHSYLILALTSKGRVTMDVGFYYMANAAGRLFGTLLSGVSYQLGGLALCLATAAILASMNYLASRRLGMADAPVFQHP